MQCTSCNGIIVKEHFYDMVDDNGVLSLGAWRWASLCLRCGNVVEDRGIPLPLDSLSSASRTDLPESESPSASAFTMF